MPAFHGQAPRDLWGDGNSVTTRGQENSSNCPTKEWQDASPIPKAQAAARPSLYPKQETYLLNRAFHSIVQLEREGNRETDRFHWYLANAGAPLLLDVWRPTGLPASIWNVLFTTVERDRQPTGSRLSRCHPAPAMNRSPGRQEDELGWPLPKGFAVKSRREVADK